LYYVKFPSFLKRGSGRFYGIVQIEKSPSIPLYKRGKKKEPVQKM
jgi:hypothetical protein